MLYTHFDTHVTMSTLYNPYVTSQMAVPTSGPGCPALPPSLLFFFSSPFSLLSFLLPKLDGMLPTPQIWPFVPPGLGLRALWQIPFPSHA